MATDEEWNKLKSRLTAGDQVSGAVTRREQWGLYLDVGEPFPGYVDIIEVKDGVIQGIEDFPQVGDHVTGRVLQLSDHSREIRVTLRSLKWPS